MSDFDDRPPGWYWIRYKAPICDGGGVVDEQWTPPEIALLNRRGRWMLVGSPVPLCFEVEILNEVLAPSAVWLEATELPERGNER